MHLMLIFHWLLCSSYYILREVTDSDVGWVKFVNLMDRHIWIESEGLGAKAATFPGSNLSICQQVVILSLPLKKTEWKRNWLVGLTKKKSLKKEPETGRFSKNWPVHRVHYAFKSFDWTKPFKVSVCGRTSDPVLITMLLFYHIYLIFLFEHFSWQYFIVNHCLPTNVIDITICVSYLTTEPFYLVHCSSFARGWNLYS